MSTASNMMMSRRMIQFLLVPWNGWEVCCTGCAKSPNYSGFCVKGSLKTDIRRFQGCLFGRGLGGFGYGYHGGAQYAFVEGVAFLSVPTMVPASCSGASISCMAWWWCAPNRNAPRRHRTQQPACQTRVRLTNKPYPKILDTVFVCGLGWFHRSAYTRFRLPLSK